MMLVVVGTAVLTAVFTVIRANALQSSLSDAAVTARNFDDAILAAPYTDCAAPGTYTETALGFDSGADASVNVDSVTYWNGQPPPSGSDPTSAQWAAAFVPNCGTDLGIQRITYTVASTAGAADSSLTRSVLKRFNGSFAEPLPDPPPGGRTCVIYSTSRVASTWVNETAWEQGTNYSSGAGSQEMNSLYLAGTRRFSYVRFDVAPNVTCDNGGTLPAAVTILAAQVRLYTFNIGGLPACGAGSCWHVMERVRSGWDQSTLTWDNQPCPTGFAVSCQPGDTPSTILFQHGTGAFDWSARFQRVQSPQLLSDVQSFYSSPSTNHGWVIKEACAQTYGKACGSATPGFQMRSSRYSNVEQRPTLLVHY